MLCWISQSIVFQSLIHVMIAVITGFASIWAFTVTAISEIYGWLSGKYTCKYCLKQEKVLNKLDIKYYSCTRGLKNTCGSGSWPTLFFFCRPYFFSTQLTVRPYFLRVVAGCSYSIPKWRLLSHTNYWTKLPKFVHRKYASLVNIDEMTQFKASEYINNFNPLK
jgi:hypothetical protein